MTDATLSIELLAEDIRGIGTCDVGSTPVDGVPHCQQKATHSVVCGGCNRVSLLCQRHAEQWINLTARYGQPIDSVCMAIRARIDTL